MPPSRFVFADLDALNQVARDCMRKRKSEFSPDELAMQFPLDPHKLTTFLSVSDGKPTLLRGVHHEVVESDVAAFRDAGWDLRTKGAGAGGNALQDLLNWNLVGDGGDDDEGGDTKAMVLVEGELSNSRLNQVDRYVEAGWNVQLYCFRAKGKTVSDRLRTQYPSSFKSVFFDRFVSYLLKDAGASNSSSVAVQPSPATSKAHSPARFVFMDLDAIAQMLFTSRTLYKTVPGAKTSGDIRLNVKALTKLVCSDDQAQVVRRVATYATSKSVLVHQLQQLGWHTEKNTLRTMAAAHERMLKEALSMTAASMRLSLVIGKKGAVLPDRTVWNRLIIDLLKAGCRVEIYSWQESFNKKSLRGSIRAFKTYPGQVTMIKLDDAVGELLYLAKKKSSADESDKLPTSSAVPRQVSGHSSSTTGKSADGVPESRILELRAKVEELRRSIAAVEAESTCRFQQQKETFEWSLLQMQNAFYHKRYEKKSCTDQYCLRMGSSHTVSSPENATSCSLM